MLPALRNGSLLPSLSVGPINRLSALFDQVFNEEPFSATLQRGSTLPLSMWEDEQNFYAEVDLPGMTEKDIEVSIHDGALIIQGERKCERKESGYDSRCYGRFQQRVILSAPVDADKVEATLARGVLSLKLPKSDEARPRKIALKSE